MIQAVNQPMTLQAFLAWLPETGRYELHNGVVVEMQPTGAHERVVGVLNRKLNGWLDQQDLHYFIPNMALVQPLGFDSGYKPDVMVIDPAALSREPLWERESVVTAGAAIKLVVEVVSTNWADDYAHKFEDYEAMGIPEYWIVDYLGLGGRRYIGSPKQPTVTVCSLAAGLYETRLLRRGEVLTSSVFPQLQIETDRLLDVG